LQKSQNMSQQDELSNSLNDLSINNETDSQKTAVKSATSKATKPNATFDKADLKERWKILGTDSEQSEQ
jgi:hypothetical protein